MLGERAGLGRDENIWGDVGTSRGGYVAVDIEPSEDKQEESREAGNIVNLGVKNVRPGIPRSGREGVLGRIWRRGKGWVKKWIAGNAQKRVLRARNVKVGVGLLEDGVLGPAGRWRRKRRRRWWDSDGKGLEDALQVGEGVSNAVCNQKYSLVTFLPKVLYGQFRMFYNLFFLLVALSQFVPVLRVGFFWTYFGPLTFVLTISIAKEASDDLKRARRDQEMNSVTYPLVLRTHSLDLEKSLNKDVAVVETGPDVLTRVQIASRDICVGDILELDTNSRVPADCIMLRAFDDSGSDHDAIFIRTDQLDGETDWKLRRPVATTQHLPDDSAVLACGGTVYASAPHREIYDFVGTFTAENGHEEPLSLENTLWANTVIASGRALALVVYTGAETRSVLNASTPKSKIGRLDHEVNRLSKLLFGLLVFLSFLLTALRGLTGQYVVYFCRYFLLLSAIIPISMRVNLDMAKLAYSYIIGRDEKVAGCVVRNSNLPEELGRVQYLLTDKTGTLTQNLMTFKKLHVGNALFSQDTLADICHYTPAVFSSYLTRKGNATIKTADTAGSFHGLSSFGTGRSRIKSAVVRAVLGVCLAHNVTPVEDGLSERRYQAASPDEVALVEFAARVGVTLVSRTQTSVCLQSLDGEQVTFDILTEFPFTSDAKRMGIIVRCRTNGKIVFYVKGADTVVGKMVKPNEWLEEESGNLAREGLRTLVYAQRELTEEQYGLFEARWQGARSVKGPGRKYAMESVRESLERGMSLIGLTGVEDRLDVGVRETLEKLRHAGIRIWMLTGDKVETATCIAVSSRLAERRQGMFILQDLDDERLVREGLQRYRRGTGEDIFVIDGATLGVVLGNVGLSFEFAETAARASSVVCCRCSPTQKAAVAGLLQSILGKRVAAIGDGGNDVSMIQQANVGIGIPGKEGMQASLASDFSVRQFCDLTRLFLWHGRNSYKRSARLAQFVMHRGLIISVIQVVYCALFFYAAVSVYSGWILVGYATVFTMCPVFSLILDEDVSEQAAETYPELYKDLQKGRSLNLKTFLIWVFKSIYQGTMIMVFSVYVLWDDEYFTTLHLSTISFTSLILTELLMVAFEVRSWHWMMVVAEMCSVGSYVAAIFVLRDTFDRSLMLTWGFLGRTLLVTLVSCLPVTVGKWLQRKFAPTPYSKLA